MAQITVATNNHKEKSEIISTRESESKIDDVSELVETLDITPRNSIEDKKIQIIEMILSIEPVESQLNLGDVNDDLIIQDGPPDGKCFFRSFIKCKRYNMDKTNLGYNPEMDDVITSLKELIILYYNTHGEDIRVDDFMLKIAIIAEHESIEGWKTNILNNPRYWGGDIEMILLSKIFDVHIKCVSRSQSRFNNDYGKTNEEKILMTLKNNHYKSILMF